MLETTKFWRNEDLGGIELLRASELVRPLARHTHDEFVIAAIESGTLRFLYGKDMQHAPAGSVVLINPGEVHTNESAENVSWSYRALYPSQDLLDHFLQEYRGKEWAFRQPVVEDPWLMSQIIDLHHSLEQPHTCLERQSRFVETLACLARGFVDLRADFSLGRREPAAVTRVRERIDAFPAERVGLDVLSQEVGLSPFHLVRVFREATGFPPHAYQTARRIQLARVLIRRGMPLTQVALEAGFSDQSHLSREFRRRMGITPGQYASARRVA